MPNRSLCARAGSYRAPYTCLASLIFTLPPARVRTFTGHRTLTTRQASTHRLMHICALKRQRACRCGLEGVICLARDLRLLRSAVADIVARDATRVSWRPKKKKERKGRHSAARHAFPDSIILGSLHFVTLQSKQHGLVSSPYNNMPYEHA